MGGCNQTNTSSTHESSCSSVCYTLTHLQHWRINCLLVMYRISGAVLMTSRARLTQPTVAAEWRSCWCAALRRHWMLSMAASSPPPGTLCSAEMMASKCFRFVEHHPRDHVGSNVHSELCCRYRLLPLGGCWCSCLLRAGNFESTQFALLKSYQKRVQSRQGDDDYCIRLHKSTIYCMTSYFSETKCKIES